MTCRECQGQLPRHVDEPLLAVERHLAACPACHAEWTALRRALDLLQREPCPPAPDLRAGVWAAVDAPRAAPAPHEPLTGLLLVLAAVTALAWWVGSFEGVSSWPLLSAAERSLRPWWEAVAGPATDLLSTALTLVAPLDDGPWPGGLAGRWRPQPGAASWTWVLLATGGWLACELMVRVGWSQRLRRAAAGGS